MKRLLVFLLGTVFGLAACRTLPPPPPPVAVSPLAAVAALRSRQEGIQSFQAKARLTLIAPGRNYSGNATVKARFPSSLSVEVVDFFGRSLMSFASDGAKLEVLFPREGKRFSGPATPGTLAAFIPPGITLPQCLRLLAGGVPFSEGDPASWQESGTDGGLVLTWQNADGTPRERIWLDNHGRAWRQEWSGTAGKPGFVAEFSDFSAAAGWPRRVKVKTAEPQTELRVAFGDLTLNPPLTPAEFSAPRPPGVVEVPFKP